MLLAALVYLPLLFELSRVRSFRVSRPGWDFPARVYSDWLELTPGRSLPADYLVAELEFRGYRVAWQDRLSPGEYRRDGNSVRIHLRSFDYPEGRAPAEQVRLDLRSGKLVEVRRTGAAKLPARLEPMLLCEWLGPSREERTFLPIDSIPRVVQDAVVASEDRRFYHHIGFDLRGTTRALFRNFQGGGVKQGGSTLTQQLARNLFLDRGRTVERKLREAVLALGLEAHLSKRQILEMYLNSVYLGKRGSTGIAGVEEASRYFFGKPVSRLDLAEAATLAGVIPAPNLYSPLRHPEAARERRDRVLEVMVGEGMVSRAMAEEAMAQPLETREGDAPPALHGYFTDCAREFLRSQVRLEGMESRGLRVFTTLDPVWQARAEEGLGRALGDFGWSSDFPLQGAFVASELHTGALLSIVGGRDYRESPFNRAYQSRRQPGSAFKVVVYSAAYDQGEGRGPWTPTTTVPDQLKTFAGGDLPWTPRNYEGEYHDHVTLAKALAKSLNVATANLVEAVGPKRVVDMATRFGFEGVKPVPSVALGTTEVTLLQMLSVIPSVCTDGKKVGLNPIRAVVDPRGEVLYTPAASKGQVMSPLAAHLMVEQLRNVVNFGTAYGLKVSYGLGRPALGKTGTTNDENDAWFIGATPELAAGIWLGYDQPQSLHRSGSQVAVPAWARIVKSLLEGFPVREFPTHPAELKEVTFDGYTGLLPNPTCVGLIRTWVRTGTEPRTICSIQHPPPVLPDSLALLGDSTAITTEPPEVSGDTPY